MIPVLREDVYQPLLVVLLTFSQTERSRKRQLYKMGQVIYRKDTPVDSVITVIQRKSHCTVARKTTLIQHGLYLMASV